MFINIMFICIILVYGFIGLNKGVSTADKVFKEPGFKGQIRIGRRVLISKSKLDEYLKQRNQKTSWF